MIVRKLSMYVKLLWRTCGGRGNSQSRMEREERWREVGIIYCLEKDLACAGLAEEEGLTYPEVHLMGRKVNFDKPRRLDEIMNRLPHALMDEIAYALKKV